MRVAPATLALTFSNGETVETTAEHPFFVQDKGFTPAGLVALGNSIVTRAGPSLEVTGIEKKDKPQTVYNFSVDEFHSYFVGHSALWVHNANYKLWPNLLGDAYQDEQRIADRLGATRIRIGFGDSQQQLEALAREGADIKWTYGHLGDLRVMRANLPDPLSPSGFSEISHAYLAENGLVIGAGHARLAFKDGHVVLRSISAHSGHYRCQPENAISMIGADKFRQYVEVGDEFFG